MHKALDLLNNCKTEEAKKLKFYLGNNTLESFLCCPKHTPLVKVRKSNKFIFMILIFNILSFSFIWFDLKEKNYQLDKLVTTAIILLINIAILIFLCCLDSGYT